MHWYARTVLPDTLTAEQIREGRSNRRNKVLAEHAAHILSYRGMGTGIPRALDAWPGIELIDNREGNQFKAVVWRFGVEEVTPQVTSLLAHVSGEMTRQQLMDAVGLKDRKHFADAYLQPALNTGLLTMTIPDKPRSRLQKYRITDLGLALPR